jgi:hypothetical protein
MLATSIQYILGSDMLDCIITRTHAGTSGAQNRCRRTTAIDWYSEGFVEVIRALSPYFSATKYSGR